MRDYRITETLRNWKANGHSGYLMTWNGKRRITHKKAKHRKAAPDWMLEEEIAILDGKEVDELIVLYDPDDADFGDYFDTEREFKYPDSTELAERIYELERSNFRNGDDGSNRFVCMGWKITEDVVIRKSDSAIEVYWTDGEEDFLKIIPSGAGKRTIERVLRAQPWVCQ